MRNVSWEYGAERLKWFLFGRRLWFERPRNKGFDRRYGVDTADEIPLVEAGIDPRDSDRCNGVYRCVWATVFHEAMAALAIEHRRFTFIDYGAGKGKAMLLASDYPFARIIGIEYSSALHNIAVRNCSVYQNPVQRCKRLELIRGDATQYAPPDEPLVCHFFNPFDTQTMRSVLAHLRALAEKQEIYIAYLNMRTIRENADVLQDLDYCTPITIRKKFAVLRMNTLRHPVGYEPL